MDNVILPCIFADMDAAAAAMMVGPPRAPRCRPIGVEPLAPPKWSGLVAPDVATVAVVVVAVLMVVAEVVVLVCGLLIGARPADVTDRDGEVDVPSQRRQEGQTNA